jgi:hypothetical protein
MCEPITIAAAASLALSAAGTAASLKAQSDYAGEQEDYQRKVQAANTQAMQQNRELATRSFLDQSYQEARNLVQTRQAATEAAIQKAAEGKRARGQVKTSAAAGGVEGLGVQQLLDDFHRQEAMFNANLETSLKFKQEQTRANFEGLGAEYSGRIAGVQPFIPQPIRQPDYLGGVLNFAGSAMGAYSRLRVQSPSLASPPEIAGGGRISSQPDYSGGREF